MNNQILEAIERLEKKSLPVIDDLEARTICPKPNAWGRMALDIRMVIHEARLMWAIDELRMDEGDSVTILCENPEPPPGAAIECLCGWTNYEIRRFEGDTLAEALSKAIEAKVAFFVP